MTSVMGIPRQIPILVVDEEVLLPGASIKITVSGSRNVAMIKSRLLNRALSTTIIGVVPREPNQDSSVGVVHPVGTAAIVIQLVGVSWPQPSFTLLMTGLCRFRIEKLVMEVPYMVGVVSQLDKLAVDDAIAWSPHQHGLLASGGGTADRCIWFWNTLTGQPLQSVDVGSQVCNIAWSPHLGSEMVSTHGYSQNEIILWNYPEMSRTAQLTGHSLRVLYLAVSPSGETIVTGAGDETLRFWKIFSKPPANKMTKSILSLHGQIR